MRCGAQSIAVLQDSVPHHAAKCQGGRVRLPRRGAHRRRSSQVRRISMMVKSRRKSVKMSRWPKVPRTLFHNRCRSYLTRKGSQRRNWPTDALFSRTYTATQTHLMWSPRRPCRHACSRLARYLYITLSRSLDRLLAKRQAETSRTRKKCATSSCTPLRPARLATS